MQRRKAVRIHSVGHLQHTHASGARRRRLLTVVRQILFVGDVSIEVICFSKVLEDSDASGIFQGTAIMIKRN